MIVQLNPPLPVHTDRGAGVAHLVIDYGLEHGLLWVVALDASGEMWSVPNSQVRMRWNYSAERLPTPAATPGPRAAVVFQPLGHPVSKPPNYGNSGAPAT